MLGTHTRSILAVRFSLFAVLLVALLIAFYGFVVFGIVQYYRWRRHHPDGS